MRLLFSFLFALFFAGVISVPTAPQRKSRSYKVERVRRGNDAIHGPDALRKAYRKYGIVPINLGIDLKDFEPINNAKHAAVNKQVDEPEQSGAVSAASVQGDAAFVSPVLVGGQKLVLNFDTGSADFWVMNSRLPKSAQQGRTVYHPSNSSTFAEITGATFNISYGDSSYAHGGVGTDTVNVGGAIVKSQAIGIPDEVSDSFIEDTYSNGLVGLGFSSLNTVKPQSQKTFFENAAETLDEPVLTAALKADGVGEYEFGVISHDKYTGEISNVTVDSSNGFWEFDSAHFAVGNGTMQSIKKTPTAIADTGTSLMLLDQDVVDAYYDQVHGAVFASSASGYIYPCNADLPNLSIAVGPKHLATVPGHLLHFSEVGVNRTTGEKVCYGGVQSNQGSSMQILGDVFLKAFFVIFDLRGPSLGIASPK
ncbi:aspergillopepsin A-like aspartic endopeptidase [Aspergillus steynii IBT 23096]|uniref:Aspergillopepsin-1 n=1 Tax=Aspergillus steynii IBT 23096 TaxID=1392250 RepID=A0A2I2GE27_9EURO|nr:aspergillopepsin A-like aspartic endopeptidase [Aspergillus steynii IBT 23096]PLB51112.1 aspergillopepsin A-like aspartic endopeptidase [Aspergillus steynii IBT 23096]